MIAIKTVCLHKLLKVRLITYVLFRATCTQQVYRRERATINIKHSRAKGFFKGCGVSLRAHVFSCIGSYLAFCIILCTTLYV